jgi:hypothetical protein
MPLWLPLLVAALLASPSAVLAQQRPPGPDFLLEPPRGSVGIRGSWSIARAGSDWYGFVTRHLTLRRGDFDASGVGGDIGFAVTRRITAVGGIDFHHSSAGSEYRDYVDNQRLPITQATRLQVMNVTAGVRIALLPPGRQVGQFAWLPRRVTPYAGGGIGALRYHLEQEGDFVDFADFAVFWATYRAGGWTPSGHALGGTHVRLNRRLALSVEGRYVFAAAALDRPWLGFEPLDLSGLRIGTGIDVTF